VAPKPVASKPVAPKTVPPKPVPPKTGPRKTVPLNTVPLKTRSAPKVAPRALRDSARAVRGHSSPASLALPRIPFVLLVLGLLGGGLVCLLVVNTTLGATSFRLSQLQRENAQLSLQEQSLQGTIQDEQAPDEIAQRAYQLGMRAETNATILDLATGRYYKLHDPASDLVAAGATAQTTGVTKTGASADGATNHGAAKHVTAKHRPAKHGPGKHRTTATKAGPDR
jgi:hypothetical protein